MIYPVITLYQPWATWISLEWKVIETRTHPRFKILNGKDVLIHAGIRTDRSELVTKNPYLTKKQIRDTIDSPNGLIICKAHVYDFGVLNDQHSRSALINCKETERWGLFLNDIEPLDEPIPIQGSMGIWYFDMDKKEKVKKRNIPV